MIWAGDGDADTFRIKIWEPSGGEVVVNDIGMNQPIGSGSIVIHTKKQSPKQPTGPRGPSAGRSLSLCAQPHGYHIGISVNAVTVRTAAQKPPAGFDDRAAGRWGDWGNRDSGRSRLSKNGSVSSIGSIVS